MQNNKSHSATSDITLFLRLGWRNIWKEKSILLFCTLAFVAELLDMRQLAPLQKSAPWLWLLLTLLYFGIFLWCFFAGMVGRTYIAYRAATDQPVTIDQTLRRVRQSWLRVALYLAVLVLTIVPFFCLIFICSFSARPQMPRIAHMAMLFSWPLATMSALWAFALTEIVVNDSGIRKSFQMAWKVFSRHFRVLALLGLIQTGAGYASGLLAGMVAMLIKSGFDITSLGKLDYISPSLSVADSSLYTLISAPGGIIITSLMTTVFLLAYIKYGGIEVIKNPAR